MNKMSRRVPACAQPRPERSAHTSPDEPTAMIQQTLIRDQVPARDEADACFIIAARIASSRFGKTRASRACGLYTGSPRRI
ncbi:hypothetical protein WT27_10915 [Burkholderia territorii]|uniref:Uncharacterized protein n=1 Tax=Burkholderia territorii TaxID=1503055 RepID=A0A119AQI5_9BURK|nr:hypothetical protein WT27_10915 [Burkholderia territorii]KVX31544.1 hypothetical protein WT31_10315 [Burkholderia territorii]